MSLLQEVNSIARPGETVGLESTIMEHIGINDIGKCMVLEKNIRLQAGSRMQAGFRVQGSYRFR